MAPNVFVEEQLTTLHQDRYRLAAFGVFARTMWRRSVANAAARPDLVRELRVVRRLGVLLALMSAAWLRVEGVPVVPAVLLPVLAWLLLSGWVWADLGLVRHPVTGAPSTHVGPANVMTVFRGWASVPVLLIALYRPGPTLGWAVVCVMAGFTDLFDGTVAQRLGQESRLGRVLDPVLDACFFSAAAFALARWGLLPAWLAVLVALRYFVPVIGGLALLFIRGRSLPVRHTPWGQRSTAATALALLLTWISAYVPLPVGVLLAAYALVVVVMALALAGILRRAPLSGQVT